MNQWDSQVTAYIDELHVRQLSACYIRSVRRELDRLGSWLKQKKPRPRLAEISIDYLSEYMKKRSPFKSKSTIYGSLSKIRCFGNYLVRVGIWGNNPAKWMKGPKVRPNNRVPKRISEEDLEKLFEKAFAVPNKFYRQLWSSVLAVLYGTGMRRGELERLNLEDWDMENGSITIDGQKTDKERKLPVPSIVVEAIESYLPQRHLLLEKYECNNENALFISGKGKRVRASQFSLAIQRLAKKAEIPHITMHQFRHTCASALMANGVELHKLREILGHSHLESTCRYTHVSDPERKEAMDSHPIIDILSSNNN